MTANEIDIKVQDLIRQFDVGTLMGHLTLVASGQLSEVKNETGRSNLYYQWLHNLMKLIKPAQVVELGAAAGISTIIMATALPRKSTIYSVDIDPQAWRWMNRDYENVTKILGDDLDMTIWDGVNLLETDVWFIDSLHTEEQLRKEFELYRPFWKKGAVVVLDDIRLPGLDKVWEEITYDKCETTTPNHYSGFGHFVV